MEFEWDETKRALNLAKHALDFADVANFDWGTAKVERDWRFDYGEERYIAVGTSGESVLAVAFTFRGDVVRVVSFRPASRKERRTYGA
jgi:uncharacterized DUF497 family protein